MRNLAVATAFGLAFVLFATTGTVNASSRCNGANPSNNACAAFWYQAGKDASGGQKTRTAKNPQVHVASRKGRQVCWYAKVRKDGQQSPLVMYAGGYKRNAANVHVIKSWSGDGWQGKYKKQCMDGDVLYSYVKEYGKVTICGKYGHNVFTMKDVRTILNAGTVGKGDPAELYSSGGASWLGV